MTSAGAAVARIRGDVDTITTATRFAEGAGGDAAPLAAQIGDTAANIDASAAMRCIGHKIGTSPLTAPRISRRAGTTAADASSIASRLRSSRVRRVFSVGAVLGGQHVQFDATRVQFRGSAIQRGVTDVRGRGGLDSESAVGWQRLARLALSGTIRQMATRNSGWSCIVINLVAPSCGGEVSSDAAPANRSGKEPRCCQRPSAGRSAAAKFSTAVNKAS